MAQHDEITTLGGHSWNSCDLLLQSIFSALVETNILSLAPSMNYLTPGAFALRTLEIIPLQLVGALHLFQHSATQLVTLGKGLRTE
jgi:hypothetical protein